MSKILVSENIKVTINLGILVAILIFMISVTISATVWKTEIESRIDTLETNSNSIRLSLDDHHTEMENLKDNQYAQEALFAEIRTDLKWIRAVLDQK